MTQETQETPSTALSFVVDCGGHSVTATLPDVFAALAPILPLATVLFGSEKSVTISSRALHSALSPARNHSTWWGHVVKQYGLVEGRDYVTSRLDGSDPANWPAIKANGGKIPTTFFVSARVAAEIAALSRSDAGQKVRAYMYAVTDAAHDTVTRHYMAALQAEKQKALAASNYATEMEEVADKVAAKAGMGCSALAAYSLEQEASDRMKKDERAKRLQEDTVALIEEALNDIQKALKVTTGAGVDKIKAIVSGTRRELVKVKNGDPMFVPHWD